MRRPLLELSVGAATSAILLARVSLPAIPIVDRYDLYLLALLILRGSNNYNRVPGILRRALQYGVKRGTIRTVLKPLELHVGGQHQPMVQSMSHLKF